MNSYQENITFVQEQIEDNKGQNEEICFCEECQKDTLHITTKGWNFGDVWEKEECDPCRKKWYKKTYPKEFDNNGNYLGCIEELH